MPNSCGAPHLYGKKAQSWRNIRFGPQEFYGVPLLQMGFAGHGPLTWYFF